MLKDSTVASPIGWIADFVQKVEVIDSHTVVFEFSEVYPAQIFDTAGEILPKHILKDVDRSAMRSHGFGREPLSSGPFRLQKWVREQFIDLVPNEKFFGKN